MSIQLICLLLENKIRVLILFVVHLASVGHAVPTFVIYIFGIHEETVEFCHNLHIWAAG